jgi:uncharacterized protein (TIGR03083 family)
MPSASRAAPSDTAEFSLADRRNIGGMTDSGDPMDLARAERTDLADLLDTLTPEQWETPSLCAGWRVRDVVAQRFCSEDVPLRKVIGRVVRAGFNPDRANAAEVAVYAGHTPEQLARRAREHLEPTGLTAEFGGSIGLTDALIHHQDIRRAAGVAAHDPARATGGGPGVRPDRAADRRGHTDPRAHPGGHRRRLEGR